MADTKVSDLAAVTDVQDTDEFVLARAGTNKKIDGVDLRSEVSLFDAYAVLRDEKAANTEGGGFTSGAWQTRTLNTEVDPDGIVSLAANQFTLQAGTYLIHARAPALAVNGHKARIQNITDATTALVGSNSFTAAAANYMLDSNIHGLVTIAAAKAFELQHRCGTTKATNGFGTLVNLDSHVEVYAEVEIWRFA